MTTDEARAVDEVRKAAAEWSEATFKRDVAAAGRILGAEYALLAPGVGEMPRALLPEYVVHSYEFRDTRLHAYGDVVVMRSRYSQRATVAGQDRSNSFWTRFVTSCPAREKRMQQGDQEIKEGFTGRSKDQKDKPEFSI